MKIEKSPSFFNTKTNNFLITNKSSFVFMYAPGRIFHGSHSSLLS